MGRRLSVPAVCRDLNVSNSLSNFTEGSAFLSEVHNDANATSLSTSDTFFDGEREIWLARANIRAKDV